MILNDTPKSFRPLVQVIDNFSRNDKLGDVFEAKVDNGLLIVCTLNMGDGKRPESAQFLRACIVMLHRIRFSPSQTLDISVLNKIFNSPTTSPSLQSQK